MAKNQHTFAKRQREIKKMRKAEDKREKKRLRKAGLLPEDDESTEGEGAEAAEGTAEAGETPSGEAKPVEAAKTPDTETAG